MFDFEDVNCSGEKLKAVEEQISKIESIKCLVKTKKRYYPNADVYNIQGTRYSLIVQKVYWPNGIGEYFVGLDLAWRVKQKNVKKYKPTNLMEILEGNLLSEEAKTEILFNLDVFLTSS